MSGVVYRFVKKYEDRFIYIAIKYSSMQFYEKASSNKVSLFVEKIEDFDKLNNEYAWNVMPDNESDIRFIDDFIVVYKARFHVGTIEYSDMIAALDRLCQGDGLMNLKTYYNKVLKEKENRQKEQEKQEKLRAVFEKRLQKERREQEKLEKQRVERQEYLRKLAERKEQKRLKELQKEAEKQAKREEAIKKKIADDERGFTLKDREQAKQYETFLAFIDKPNFRKLEESPEKVFDFIDVYVGLTQMLFDDDYPQLLEKYITRINQDVMKSVEDSKGFKKYGIPINFVKIDKVTFNPKARTLYYLLSLKEV